MTTSLQARSTPGRKGPGSNMTAAGSFDANAQRYDDWFEDNTAIYRSELDTILDHLPANGRRIEIGAGTGRFAVPAGIRLGVEPSRNMAAIAKARGIDMIQGVGESLPLRDAIFDHVLMVTVLCFVNNVRSVLSETERILRPGGQLTVGIIDRNSPRTIEHVSKKKDGSSLRGAALLSTGELVDALEDGDFDILKIDQTILQPVDEVRSPQKARKGSGSGMFVVITSKKA